MFTVTDIIFIVLQILVFLLSTIGNAIVVIVFYKYIKGRTITNKFIINLAVADMLTGSASILQVVYTAVPSLNANIYTCLLRYQVVILLTLTSQLTVTFTTLDRYIAICHPHDYVKMATETKSNILIGISWIYPSIVCFLPFTGLYVWEGDEKCLFQQVVRRWQLLWTSLTMWLFTIVTLTMYGLILKKAWSLYRNLTKVSPHTSSITEQSIREDGVPTADRGRVTSASKTRRNKILSSLRGAKALAAVTILFTVCWLPLTYFQFRGFLSPEYLHSADWEVASWIVFIGMTNSIMNPFIYAWQRKDFNQAFKRLMRCKRKLHIATGNQKTVPASRADEF